MNPLSLFLQNLRSLSRSLESSQIEEHLRHQIEKVFKATEIHVETLINLQTEYTEVVDKYLKAKPPFEWNRNQNSKRNADTDPNFKKDIDQYQTLIEYSLFAGDTKYRILKQWGINYPLSSQGPGLSQPISEYKKILAWIRDKKASEIQKPYYTYLINNLT